MEGVAASQERNRSVHTHRRKKPGSEGDPVERAGRYMEYGEEPSNFDFIIAKGRLNGR